MEIFGGLVLPDGQPVTGNGNGLTNIPGSQITSAVPSARGAAVATNLVVAMSGATSGSIPSIQPAIAGGQQLQQSPISFGGAGGTTNSGNLTVQGNFSATGTISGLGSGLTGIPSTKWVIPITNGLTLLLVPTSIVATNNGTNVTQWTDMSGSGNNFVMPALANQPMQLGSGDSASVYWPVGNSAYLTNGTLALNSTNFTMLFVFTADTATSEGALFQAIGNNPTFYNTSLNSNYSDFTITNGLNFLHG